MNIQSSACHPSLPVPVRSAGPGESVIPFAQARAILCGPTYNHDKPSEEFVCRASRMICFNPIKCATGSSSRIPEASPAHRHPSQCQEAPPKCLTAPAPHGESGISRGSFSAGEDDEAGMPCCFLLGGSGPLLGGASEVGPRHIPAKSPPGHTVPATLCG